METIAIIGGGAAGLAAAVAAARGVREACEGAHEARDACEDGRGDVEVVVFEADERVGRSILATGNGRCNFSNAQVEAGLYRNAAFVAAAFEALEARCCGQRRAGAFEDAGEGACEGAGGRTSCRAELTARGYGGKAASGSAGKAAPEGAGMAAPDGANGAASPCPEDPVHAFFADLGLMWREEGEGRLYPLANKASSVLDVLRAALARAGVVLTCEHRATRIDVPERPDGRYHVRFADGSVAHARSVIVATGGRTARDLLPGGLPFAEPRAVLGPLRTDTAVVKPLNNIRVRCAATLVAPDGLPKASETGEVLFRDYGVSGIAAFNLSRFVEPGDTLLLDLLPQLDGFDGRVVYGGADVHVDIGLRCPLAARAVNKSSDALLVDLVQGCSQRFPAACRTCDHPPGLHVEGLLGRLQAALQIRRVGDDFPVLLQRAAQHCGVDHIEFVKGLGGVGF